LQAAKRFLSGFGTVKAVVTAPNGLEALQAVLLERPDLVLLDLNMPGMGGLEAVRRIKALEPAIRVIVISLHDTADFRSAAKEAGADGYVCKSDFAAGLSRLLAEQDDRRDAA
jgi:DNA-binding NarL/FixJ family response regulator